MHKIWKATEIVRAHQVDLRNRLKLSSFFNFAQHAASVHADSLGLGYKYLMSKRLFWVLSWIKFEIISYPGMDDKIHIETWPKSKYRLFSLRDFFFYNEEKQVIAKASTAWLMVNAKTKRATDTSEIIDNKKYNKNKVALNDLPEKIPDLKNAKKVNSFIVQYSDIDILQHMNNARYVDHLLDSYNYDYHKSHRAKSIILSYLHEAKANDIIDINSDMESTNTKHFFEAVNKANKQPVFKAIVEW
ncbi:MAG: hypothetical protein GXO79_05545 [Chlorobi bacterium]|nr:hypothetical protein [Chlorobiota bacterium]